MLELNKSNFEKELKTNKILVVDLWAEWCIEPSTKILTADDNFKVAREIDNLDSLLTYNGKELIADKVKKSFTSNMLGHCKEIITESDRKIKVTDEHEFLTPNGWKKAKDLKEKEKVAVIPKYFNSKKIKENREILNERDLNKKALKSMHIGRYIKELKDKGLLPLKLSNDKILIISRLLGSAFTDGNLYFGKSNNYREVSFSLGTKEDVKRLIKDLEGLGFNKYHIKNQRKKIKVNDREYIANIIRVKSCSTSLWLLLKSLGAPVGDKTNLAYDIPNWLMKAPKAIKKEFLSAFMGGDGPKITMRLSNRIRRLPYNTMGINDLEFHKNPEVAYGGIKLANQLSRLFKEFNIEINNIFVENDNYVKKDGNKSKIIHISFKHNFENAFNLYKNIGYKYANTKDLESMQSAEFIRRILYKRKIWLSKYNEAVRLNKTKGYGYRRLSRILGINSHTIWQWIKKDVKPTVSYHRLKFPQWLKDNTKGLNGGLMWEEIREVKDTYLGSVQKIAMQNNHNFIANSFLAHNCGPCKAMAPIFEELSKEIKGIKFAKLNVDENTNIASSLGVMSIPTFIIFKNGKEIERMIGSNSKNSMKSKIESVMN